ncbi:MAG TPA: hypothetical protein VGB45_09735 [Abditibacterium sp.]|jgi:Flp pilus assembly protein TadG
MKLLILIVLFFFAIGIAMALLARLTRIQQRMADLHRDLNQNDVEMARHRREIERLAAQQDAQDGNRDVKS